MFSPNFKAILAIHSNLLKESCSEHEIHCWGTSKSWAIITCGTATGVSACLRSHTTQSKTDTLDRQTLISNMSLKEKQANKPQSPKPKTRSIYRDQLANKLLLSQATPMHAPR